MFIQTEPTPNPATLKFLPGRAVLAHGTLDMRDKAAASQSPLAERLFEIDGVERRVLRLRLHLRHQDGDGEWQQLKPAILGAIMEHFMSGAPVLRAEDQARPAKPRRRVLRPGGCRDGRHHQGSDRDAGAPGGRQ